MIINRCKATTNKGHWGRQVICSNRARHNSDYCGVHDPETIATRKARTQQLQEAKWAERKYELWGKKFYSVLTQIEHPAAKEILEKFHDS